MKRAKFLLTIIGVLAIVGGALAFKASSKFTVSYCLGTVSTLGACPTFASPSVDDPNGTVLSYYTITTGTSCASGLKCNGFASLAFKHD